MKSLETFVHKPIKRNIFLREVEQQECIFSYSEYPGFYVLRCNLVKCKKALDQDEGTIFKSHPFRNGLAEEHFTEEWHDIKSETEIFRRFAIRGASHFCSVFFSASRLLRPSMITKTS